MGYMTMEVELPDGGLVRLTGSMAVYWKGEGLPTYEGPIDGLPERVLRVLVEQELVRK